jgi:hypothetical protein
VVVVGGVRAGKVEPSPLCTPKTPNYGGVSVWVKCVAGGQYGCRGEGLGRGIPRMGWNWWVAAACVLAYVCLHYRHEALALWARVRRAHHARVAAWLV